MDELLSGVGDQKNSRLLEDLRPSSALLRTIHEDFATKFVRIRNCEVVSFFQGNEKVRFLLLKDKQFSGQEANMRHSTVYREVITQLDF
jgi:hypothetical protein